MRRSFLCRSTNEQSRQGTAGLVTMPREIQPSSEEPGIAVKPHDVSSEQQQHDQIDQLEQDQRS